MIRGTTAKFKFEIPYPFNELNTTTQVIFWQPGNNEMAPIIKTKADGGCCCSESNPNELIVTLCPEETYLFHDDMKAKGQLRGTVNGTNTTFASKEQIIEVYPLYKDCDISGIGSVTPINNFCILDGGTIE